MTENISPDFLEAFGLTEADVQEAQNNSGETDANPDAQQVGQGAGADADTSAQQGADTTETNATAQQDNQSQNDDSQQDAQDQNADDAAQRDNRVKANAAFAQMRSENTALKKLVNDIAGVLGVNPNTPPAQVQAAVQDAILRAQAKQQNLDPAVLHRLQQLEQYKEANERQSLSNRALMGFQTVKNQFSLTDKELDSFADQLMKDGVNPFTTSVDLVAEYKLRNFDKLLAAAEQRGAAKEAERQQNVANHSSQPSKTTGAGSDSEPDKITSTTELTNWFDKNKTN